MYKEQLFSNFCDKISNYIRGVVNFTMNPITQHVIIKIDYKDMGFRYTLNSMEYDAIVNKADTDWIVRSILECYRLKVEEMYFKEVDQWTLNIS